MANPYQQKARQRKQVYAALILVLLTGSLLHRRLVVEPQAYDLQLREVARGEVELTGSAVRLLTTGSRGLATTILWSTAIEKQKQHEWNELELVVNSITKLQPYFITPWLFQSWNLAFNVAVECDQPRDKFYYVSRGLTLLAEGERRNQGSGDEAAPLDPRRPRFPGHPELRHHMGFTYQLKIGNSDEKNTMRCLLDLSTIDPVKRNPDELWPAAERGQRALDPKEYEKYLDNFAKFCQDHPRLVRRLREQLGYNTPRQVVQFLRANRDVPSRFKKGAGNQVQSELEERTQQFPILPPALADRWPDPAKEDLGLARLDESFDVFLVCRTWFDYSLRPLPPPNPNPGLREPDYDRQRYRMPKAMAVQLFRHYPPLAQTYIAENLEAEGWFDAGEDRGWAITDWFEKYTPGTEGVLTVGKEGKLNAGRAWDASYKMHKVYGVENGLYLSPSEVEELNRKAQLIRDRLKLRPGERLMQLRSDLRTGALGESYDAQMKLAWNEHYRQMTNFDSHLDQADGERDPLTVYGRKLFYQAERARRFEAAPDVALALYEEAWPLWVAVCLRHPKFAQLSLVQEDVYELHLKYLRLAQDQRANVFRPALLAAAQLAVWPHPSWEDWGWLTSSQKIRILPVRNVHGPLDNVQYYDGPAAAALREFLLGWTTPAAAYAGTAFVPPVPFPGEQNYLLARAAFRDTPVPDGWKSLISTEAIRNARERLGQR